MGEALAFATIRMGVANMLFDNILLFSQNMSGSLNKLVDIAKVTNPVAPTHLSHKHEGQRGLQLLSNLNRQDLVTLVPAAHMHMSADNRLTKHNHMPASALYCKVNVQQEGFWGSL